MEIYAIVNSAGAVENVIVWDGDTTNWQPPTGATAVEVTETTGLATIGATYVNGQFSEPA